MSEPLCVTVNGRAMHLAAGTTLEGLLTHLGVRRAGVAIEMNRAILPRSRHASTRLREGDTVEIVTLVGGG